MLCRGQNPNTRLSRGNCLTAPARCTRLSSATCKPATLVLNAEKQPRSPLSVSAGASGPLQPRPRRPSPTSPTSTASNERYQDRVLETAYHNSAGGMHSLQKRWTKEIAAAQSLDGLLGTYSTTASHFDTVCLATVWVRLAKLPDDVAPEARRLAFIRKALLGKTLAMVEQMGLRPLSNVLWAIGKLRLDLTKEQPLGPYLAEQLAGRIRRLVAAGALEVDMDASQLWYGMFFCQYPWPSEFLDELLDRSLPYLEVWGDVAVAEIFYNIGAFMNTTNFVVGQQQLQQLAQQAGRYVTRMDKSSPSALKLTLSMVSAAESLSLPLSPSCIQALHDLAITTPAVAASVDTMLTAAGLFNLVQLGYQLQPDELAKWYDLLMTAWRADRRDNEAFSWLVAAFHSAQLSPVPKELKVELATVATRPRGWTPASADRVLGAARAWKVQLPRDAAARLAQISAARQTTRGRAVPA